MIQGTRSYLHVCGRSLYSFIEHNIKGSPANLTFLYLPNETMHKGASDLQLKQSWGKALPWRCGRALVAKLGVSTVPGEVT